MRSSLSKRRPPRTAFFSPVGPKRTRRRVLRLAMEVAGAE